MTFRTGQILVPAGRRQSTARNGRTGQEFVVVAACIVCETDTDLVETNWLLPACASCEPPIETWTFRIRRRDGKRGYETIRVGRRADGWRTGVNERLRRAGTLGSSPATCSATLAQMNAGVPFCDGIVVWKAARIIGRRHWITVWCDTDLPADVRPDT